MQLQSCLCGQHSRFPQHSCAWFQSYYFYAGFMLLRQFRSARSPLPRKPAGSSWGQVQTNVHYVLRRANVRLQSVVHLTALPRGSVVVKALCYKPEGRGFQTRTRPWGVQRGRCVGLTTLPPYVSRLSKCGVLSILQLYRPPKPVTGIALFVFFLFPYNSDSISWNKWKTLNNILIMTRK
jgi:hypothetical protein